MLQTMAMNDSDVIWVNLKVLSTLQPFQKLSTRQTHFQLQSHGASTTYLGLPEFILRWWAGSNRESDFQRLKELYQSATNHLKHTNDKTRMIVHLQGSIKGLNALQKTYETDATMKAKIDWLIDSVNKTIQEHGCVQSHNLLE